MLNANWKQEGSGKKYRLKPYWANPAIRNFREGGGNIGIIEAQLAPLLYSTLNVVSILVLMESTFRPHTHRHRQYSTFCFNPCFNGIDIQTGIRSPKS